MNQVENFRKALQFTLKWEGGYVNDPDDPGGETKWGISKRAYPNLDIKNLTPEAAASIYAKDYWDRCSCDSLSYPLCVAVFDSAVQHGCGRAISWLKGATDVGTYLLARKLFYINLVKQNPRDQKFLGGWLNRVADLQKLTEIAQEADSN